MFIAGFPITLVELTDCITIAWQGWKRFEKIITTSRATLCVIHKWIDVSVQSIEKKKPKWEQGEVCARVCDCDTLGIKGWQIKDEHPAQRRGSERQCFLFLEIRLDTLWGVEGRGAIRCWYNRKTHNVVILLNEMQNDSLDAIFHLYNPRFSINPYSHNTPRTEWIAVWRRSPRGSQSVPPDSLLASSLHAAMPYVYRADLGSEDVTFGWPVDLCAAVLGEQTSTAGSDESA